MERYTNPRGHIPNINGLAHPTQRDKILSHIQVNPDNSVTVYGDVDMINPGLKPITGLSRLPIKFDTIYGNFFTSGLTTLEGCPHTISHSIGSKNGGLFYCSSNYSFTRLGNLKGGPKEVASGYYCHTNKLTSLEGAPESVGGDFDCKGNLLTSLVGLPSHIGKNLYCSDNELSNLDGAPNYVGGVINLHNNPECYDPYGIRYTQIGSNYNLDFLMRFNNTPFFSLMKMFHNCGVLDKFQESLDYQYIKGNKIDTRIFDQMGVFYELKSCEGYEENLKTLKKSYQFV